MAEGKREVDELRQEIAKLDAQLLVALDKRAKAARRLGELRREAAPSLPLTDHAAIRALVARSTGDMPQDALRDMLGTADKLAKALNAEVFDAKRKPLTAASMRELTAEIDGWARANSVS